MGASIPPRVCLDVTTCEIHLCGVGLLDAYPFFALCDADMLALLALGHPLAFLAFMHLCMLAYMFMHESLCHPYSNLVELWTLDPNLRLSS